MLQQTTVATVLARFEPFLRRFPTLTDLAAAELDAVLHAWQGLGYYRRARGLHACARAICDDYGGRVPNDPDRLARLPGIGPYTAAAVAAIAFDRPVLAVDGNVERVLARLFVVETPLPQAKPEIRRLAARLAPVERPGDTVQAIMDLGATLCRPAQPACLACPLRAGCGAHQAGLANVLPHRAAKPVRPQRHAVAFHLMRPDGAVLLRRRPEDGLLGGMIELPTTPWVEAPLDDAAVRAAAPAPVEWQSAPSRVRHVFTHLVLNVDVLVGRLNAAAPPLAWEPIWCAPDAFDTLALPTLTRKLLAQAEVAGRR